MNLTAPAAATLTRLAITHPADAPKWRAWAERIACAYGRTRIGKADIEAAIRCAGEEFLPDVPPQEGEQHEA